MRFDAMMPYARAIREPLLPRYGYVNTLRRHEIRFFSDTLPLR